METKKSFWEIIKGTLTGVDNEGSAKRITTFYFAVILITSLTLVYEYCFYLAVISLVPTVVQVSVVKMYEAIHFSLQLTLWLLCGLATVETVTSLIRTIRGKEDPKQEG